VLERKQLRKTAAGEQVYFPVFGRISESRMVGKTLLNFMFLITICQKMKECG
jgi:hypothetical protein